MTRGRWSGWLALVAVAAGVSSGCENEKCEKARVGLASAWENLRNTATSRQQIPPASDLSEDEQKEQIRVWTEIETKAEMIRSSFETPQVTWSPAQKARAELAASFAPVAGSKDPMTQGFARELAEADTRMAEFGKSCR
jgi:hypothetical protein